MLKLNTTNYTSTGEELWTCSEVLVSHESTKKKRNNLVARNNFTNWKRQKVAWNQMLRVKVTQLIRTSRLFVTQKYFPRFVLLWCITVCLGKVLKRRKAVIGALIHFSTASSCGLTQLAGVQHDAHKEPEGFLQPWSFWPQMSLCLKVPSSVDHLWNWQL